MSKSIAGILCISLLITLAFIVEPGMGKNTLQPLNQYLLGGNQDSPLSVEGQDAPRYAIYRHIFRHVVALKKDAADIERKGGDGSSARHWYKIVAKLNDKQEAALDRIADKCEMEIKKQDAKANKIIAQHQALVARLSPGEPIPPLPSELGVLQKDRNAIILRARVNLRVEFGEAEFKRFDEFVRQSISGSPQSRE
ncbi:MAG: hypothetical protein QOG71_3906 [Pyrinomonadaceae bacterium]|nr:hypothetical protein [Pyrinomonadaceae bacterium]